MFLRYAAALSTVVHLAAATCQLENFIAQDGDIAQPSGPQLCLSQGAGDWTFSMYASAVSVPTFDGDNPLAGYSQQAFFMVYDNTCTLRGTYGIPNCDPPWSIEENFFSDVLVITSVDLDPAGPYFSFNYGNGKYSLGYNHCVCEGMNQGLMAANGCKCAFPVDGINTS